MGYKQLMIQLPWQVQLDYSGKQSILFELHEGFVKFMNKVNGDTASKKEVLEKLASDYNMRIIQTSTSDDDRVGFKRSVFLIKCYTYRDLSVHTNVCHTVATRCLCCRQS